MITGWRTCVVMFGGVDRNLLVGHEVICSPLVALGSSDAEGDCIVVVVPCICEAGVVVVVVVGMEQLVESNGISV